MNDSWDFNINNLRKWHWRRIAPNGDVVGSGPKGYSRRADCEKNARRNGWVPENMIEQDWSDEEEIIEEPRQAHENSSSPGNDRSILGSGRERITEKMYRMTRDSRQRKMMILIASFLGLILLATLLILFQADQEMESSEIPGVSARSAYDLSLIRRVSWNDKIISSRSQRVC